MKCETPKILQQCDYRYTGSSLFATVPKNPGCWHGHRLWPSNAWCWPRWWENCCCLYLFLFYFCSMNILYSKVCMPIRCFMLVSANQQYFYMGIRYLFRVWSKRKRDGTWFRKAKLVHWPYGRLHERRLGKEREDNPVQVLYYFCPSLLLCAFLWCSLFYLVRFKTR